MSEEIWSSAPSQAFPLLGVMEFGRERLPDQKVGQTVGIVFMAWFSEAGGGGRGGEEGEGVKPSAGFSKVRRAWWFPKFSAARSFVDRTSPTHPLLIPPPPTHTHVNTYTASAAVDTSLNLI